MINLTIVVCHNPLRISSFPKVFNKFPMALADNKQKITQHKGKVEMSLEATIDLPKFPIKLILFMDVLVPMGKKNLFQPTDCSSMI